MKFNKTFQEVGKVTQLDQDFLKENKFSAFQGSLV